MKSMKLHLNLLLGATVLLLVTTTQVKADDTECPDGWLERVTRCYYISNSTTDWYTAWQFCAKLRAHLFSVDSKAERDNVKSQLSIDGENDYWTSGANLHVTRDWAWYGLMRRIVYKDFCNGVAADSRDPDNINGRCLSLSAKCGYSWVPRDCQDSSLRYICEKDANLSTL